MAFKRNIADRLFKIYKTSSQSLTNCRVSSPSVQSRISKKSSKGGNIAPDPGDSSIFRRLFHKGAISQTAEFRPMQIGENLMEKLRAFDIVKGRIQLDGLRPPVEVTRTTAESSPESEGLSVEDARKLLRVAQMEMIKTKLREIERIWIPYSEFVRICGEACSDPEQAIGVTKTLDESGTVIVLGNVVLLKPEQVMKAIGGLIPFPETNPNDPRRKELEKMEKQKAEIDRKADTLVRRELWCGLGYLFVQTAGFMRLTFWELSWDVMEPICFYVTSIYFMACYAFFLRTSKEPSFEGFYQSRFSAKQKKLMKAHNFDLERYNELRKICYPNSKLPRWPSGISAFDKVEKIELH